MHPILATIELVSVLLVIFTIITLPVIGFLYEAYRWGREHDDEQNT